MIIRRATSEDWPAIWAILEPVFRAGETYAVARDITEDTARTIWMETPAETFVAVTNNDVFGTYYIKTNYQGGAAHICNCGYVPRTGRRAGAWRARCANIPKTSPVTLATARCSSIWCWHPMSGPLRCGKDWDLRLPARSLMRLITRTLAWLMPMSCGRRCNCVGFGKPWHIIDIYESNCDYHPLIRKISKYLRAQAMGKPMNSGVRLGNLGTF